MTLQSPPERHVALAPAIEAPAQPPPLPLHVARNNYRLGVANGVLLARQRRAGAGAAGAPADHPQYDRPEPRPAKQS
jgi:hypothetical protein